MRCHLRPGSWQLVRSLGQAIGHLGSDLILDSTGEDRETSALTSGVGYDVMGSPGGSHLYYPKHQEGQYGEHNQELKPRLSLLGLWRTLLTGAYGWGYRDITAWGSWTGHEIGKRCKLYTMKG